MLSEIGMRVTQIKSQFTLQKIMTNTCFNFRDNNFKRSTLENALSIQEKFVKDNREKFDDFQLKN